MTGWLTISKASDWSKNTGPFNLRFSIFDRIFSVSTIPICSFFPTVHCGYLCMRVASVYEWQSSSKETWKGYLDIEKQTSRWLFSRLEGFSQINDLPERHLNQPTEWTSHFLQSVGSRGSPGWISGSRSVLWTNTTSSMLFKGYIFEACHNTVTSFSGK